MVVNLDILKVDIRQYNSLIIILERKGIIIYLKRLKLSTTLDNVGDHCSSTQIFQNFELILDST